jgi:hypothetical protein
VGCYTFAWPISAFALIGPRLCRIADSFLRNERRYNVGYGQNEGSSVVRVMLPPPLVRIFVASGLHSQRITDFNYGGGTFELAHEGDTLMRIFVASGLHPQPTADFNYSRGTFELAHKGDALIRESQWSSAHIPNIIYYIITS